VPKRPPDPAVVRIAGRLLSQVDALADEMTVLIAGQIDIYRSGGLVGRDDLRRSNRHNFSYVLSQIAQTEPADLTAPRETGRRRAEQGAPLPEVLRAYRLGFAFLWERLLAEARGTGDNALDVLLDTATDVWAWADDYSQALADAYRGTIAVGMVRADRRRSALVEALTGGPVSDRDTAWEVAKLLGFPFEGRFLLVVAETSTIAAEALPGLEDRLRAMDVASAWRSQPDFEVGVISYGRRRSVGEILETAQSNVTGRAGISPEYGRLDQTPRAMRFAQVALESLLPGTKELRQLDDSPLGELVMASVDTTSRVVRRILRDVLTLPDDDRSTLLATAQAWIDARGSTAEAGKALYCHVNTVRYRLRRLEEHLGRSLDDPTTVAELTTALQAVRTYPALATQIEGPTSGA
jgi:hypothetical protein